MVRLKADPTSRAARPVWHQGTCPARRETRRALTDPFMYGSTLCRGPGQRVSEPSLAMSATERDRDLAFVITAIIGSADGMTPTDRCPVNRPAVFFSVAISCCSDVQLSRIACAHLTTRSPSGVRP